MCSWQGLTLWKELPDFHLKGKSCSRRKLPSSIHLEQQYTGAAIPEYIIQSREGVLNVYVKSFGATSPSGHWHIHILTLISTENNWWTQKIQSSEVSPMKNNDPSLPISHRKCRDKKETENEGKDYISKEPQSFRGTERDWPCTLRASGVVY